LNPQYDVDYVVPSARWFTSFSCGEALLEDWLGFEPADFKILVTFTETIERWLVAKIDAGQKRRDAPPQLSFDDLCTRWTMEPSKPWFPLLATRAVLARA
jgi:hypothetical protein